MKQRAKTPKKKVKYYNLPDETPETQEPPRTKRRKEAKKRRFLKIGLLVIFAAILLAIVTGLDMADSTWLKESIFGGSEGKGYPVTINGTEASYRNFTLVGSRPAYVSDTHFVILNQKGGADALLQHRYRTPVLEQSSRYYLIYDLGNKGYSIYNTRELLHSNTLTGQILCGDIGNNGTYAIASSTSGFASQMTVYSKDYAVASPEIYSWQSPSCRITALAVSPSGKEVVAAGLSGENGELKTTLYVFDLTSDQPKMTYELGDTIVLSLEYQSKKKVSIIGDHGTFVYDTEETVLTGYPYEGEQLFGYACTEDAIQLLISPYESGENSHLAILNASGTETLDLPLNEVATAVAEGKDAWYVLAGNTVVGYDAEGTQIFRQEVGSDARNILCKGDQLYVLGLQEIRCYEIKD